MIAIDYDAPAELYARRQDGAKRHLFYQRFATVAEALQYAVEDLPANASGVLVETGEERLEGRTIRAMYDAEAYPLARSAGKAPAR